MANPTTRGRGTASGQRTMAAAARAAAKRTERVRTGAGGSSDGPDGSGLAAASRAVPLTDVPAEAPDDVSQARRPEEQHVGRVLVAADTVRARRLTRGRVCAALALLLVAALVASGVLGLEYARGSGADAARTEALAAARKAAPVVLSYDHRRLDKDFAEARTWLTGSFRDEYGRTTKTVVAPTAKKYRGTVKASVVRPPDGGAPAASVVSASPDKVVVLLFVNQVTTSTQVTGSRVDLNRVRMTMTRTDSGWKVSAVDAL
ncbi:hypothetical protein J7E88_02485 [Streptomyces sp. ISL-10]|uniref:hypothetical protein n=1 Tax=Streptomyces sp. ISL-10 TaxID=2819172 RepID=UPI001BE9CAAF|nr:hypothetical protein [Streptomyces sp. ISL-10]MBT2364226.1 hypothetical protein [Streptomyces sp. ISL-10]